MFGSILTHVAKMLTRRNHLREQQANKNGRLEKTRSLLRALNVRPDFESVADPCCRRVAGPVIY